MNRRCQAFQHIDLELWPAFDRTALASDKKAFFALRCRAIEAYVKGTPLRQIEQDTGINCRQLYRTLTRCLQQAEDGRIYGYRGLIKHSRVGTYVRKEKISAVNVSSRKGLAGAFSMLIESYPALHKWLM